MNDEQQGELETLDRLHSIMLWVTSAAVALLLVDGVLAIWGIIDLGVFLRAAASIGAGWFIGLVGVGVAGGGNRAA